MVNVADSRSQACLDGLYVEDVPRGDVHIDVWVNSPGSGAFVYGKVLSAVQSSKKK